MAVTGSEAGGRGRGADGGHCAGELPLGGGEDRRQAEHAVVFRCDASSHVGLGHLARCVNLADALADRGVRCTFVMRAPPAAAAAMVAARGHLLHTIDSGAGDHGAAHAGLLGEFDARALVDTACRAGASAVILDHYGARDSYLQAVAAMLLLVVIDDLNDRDLRPASVVVNATPGAEGWAYDLTCGEVLAGSRFALLHRAFARERELSPSRRIAPPRRVVVSLGGGDAAGLDVAVARRLRGALPDAHIQVLSGPVRGESPGSRQWPKSRAAERSNGIAPVALDRTERVGPLAPEGVAKLFAAADLAVVSASTTCLELACLRVPALVVVRADNQRYVGEALRAQELALVSADIQGFEAQLEATLAEPAIRALERLARWAAITDGQGAARVAEKILTRLAAPRGVTMPRDEAADGAIAPPSNVVSAAVAAPRPAHHLAGTTVAGSDRRARASTDTPGLVVRACAASDADLLHAWRNDPDAREMSLRSDPVAWDEHLTWLGRALRDRDRLLLLAEVVGEPCGSLRFDRTSPESARVSIVVAPLHRGKGYARLMLHAGVTQACERWPWLTLIAAEIRVDNVASIRSFERAGFRRAAESDFVAQGGTAQMALWTRGRSDAPPAIPH